MCWCVQFVGFDLEECIVMLLGPLFLLEWTTLSIFGPGGLFCVIMFILLLANPQLGF